MTDDIKVGDRFLVPVEVTGSGSLATAIKIDGLHDSMMPTIWMRPAALSACTRLPPEIGVGDEVTWDHDRKIGNVVHVSGEWAWVHAPMYEAIHALSDLTLVKKAEKD